MAKKLFDYVIGNPPYQEDTNENNKSYPRPLYDKFMDEVYKIANKVELITPARFLFNAGGTKKDWNKKMLSDPHLKVLEYSADCSKYFDNVDIKGGIAITYRDDTKDFGAIEIFTPYEELNTLLHKIINNTFTPLSEKVSSPLEYRFTNLLYKDFNEIIQKLKAKGNTPNGLKTFSFDKMPEMFYDNKPQDSNIYIYIYGLLNSKRVFKWFRKDYVNEPENLFKYKLFLPKADGKGEFGELLTNPVIAEPGSGHTETFISIGSFDTENEAKACLKYIKSKFARTLLGALKVTQDNTKEKWKYVPLQDFTDKSDIDWSVPIPEIDAQLYKKYGLDDKEIEFIESKVKAME